MTQTFFPPPDLRLEDLNDKGTEDCCPLIVSAMLFLQFYTASFSLLLLLLFFFVAVLSIAIYIIIISISLKYLLLVPPAWDWCVERPCRSGTGTISKAPIGNECICNRNPLYRNPSCTIVVSIFFSIIPLHSPYIIAILLLVSFKAES